MLCLSLDQKMHERNIIWLIKRVYVTEQYKVNLCNSRNYLKACNCQ
jgi:hypothetical protein